MALPRGWPGNSVLGQTANVPYLGTTIFASYPIKG